MTSTSARPDGAAGDGADSPGAGLADPNTVTGDATTAPDVAEPASADAETPAEGSGELVPAEHGPRVIGHPDPRLTGDAPVSTTRTLSLLLYSDDVDTRARVRLAIGRRVASDLPPVEFTEIATHPAVIAAVDGGHFDVLILDGEAVPAGGLGLCKQLKDEIYQCPPVLVLTGRPQDAWLATWSRADAAVPHPLDPGALASAVAGLARTRLRVGQP